MNPATERRLLQAGTALACIVPLAAGGLGVLRGPAFVHGIGGTVPQDLDSHFRYLSGLLLGIGLAYASLIPRIERSGAAYRLLGFLVVVGGCARAVSTLSIGLPGPGHIFGLAMELGVVPLLILWQARVARISEPPRPR